MVVPRLYAIVDVDTARAHGLSAVEVADAFLDGGARWLQVRGKSLGSRALLELSEAVVRLAEPAGAMVIVNDRADVARLAGARGVHVGQDDLGVTAVRSLLGSAAVVGLSTHTEEQMLAATETDASYLAIGPIFATATKATGYEPVGLEAVRRAAAAAGRPVVAIGGITLERAPGVIEAGAAAVAVIGDLLTGGNPARRVKEYLSILG